MLQRFAVGDAHAGVRRECLMALLTMHRRGLALEASCYAAADQALDDHHEEVRFSAHPGPSLESSPLLGLSKIPVHRCLDFLWGEHLYG
jgi:hypothetical protein